MAYGGEFGSRRRGWRGRRRGSERRWPEQAPRRPARGFPVRGIHTYDLDYGRQAGGPETDYSGRAGWPTGIAEEAERRRPRGAWFYGAWYRAGPPWPRRREEDFEEQHRAAAEPSPYGRPGRRRRGFRRGRP